MTTTTRMLPPAAALALAVALAVAPASLAHEPPAPQTECNATQNPHDFEMTGGLQLINVLWREPVYPVMLSGQHEAFDGNFCQNPDGTFVGFDGDYEFSKGGAFLPWGVWAADPTCDYGYSSHHGQNVRVVPSTPENEPVHFRVGADTTAPTLVPSGNPDDDDGLDCVTDGSITPETDLDDWIEPCVDACQVSGAPGGDGGLTVVIDCAAEPQGHSLDPPTPPSSVFATCTFSGHVYSS